MTYDLFVRNGKVLWGNGTKAENLRSPVMDSFWKQCLDKWYGVVGHEDIYERFSKGESLYLAESGDNKKIIRLKISNLKEGKFDLSACGDAAKYLTVTINPLEFFTYIEKKYFELVILIAPTYLIKQRINTCAAPFARIMNKLDEKDFIIAWRFRSWEDLSKYAYRACSFGNLPQKMDMEDAECTYTNDFWNKYDRTYFMYFSYLCKHLTLVFETENCPWSRWL